MNLNCSIRQLTTGYWKLHCNSPATLDVVVAVAVAVIAFTATATSSSPVWPQHGNFRRALVPGQDVRLCQVRLLSNFNKQSLQLHPSNASRETICQSISWSIDQCNPPIKDGTISTYFMCVFFFPPFSHCRLLDIWRRVLWYLGGLWCHVLDGVYTESVRHINGPLHTHQGSAQVSAATKHETRWWPCWWWWWWWWWW